MGNPYSPYGIEKQSEMINQPKLFEEKIRYFTSKYATPSLGYKEYKEYKDWDFTYPRNK